MNRLSEAAKFLIIAGTILIVCSLVVVGFFVMKEGKEGTNNSMLQFSNITSNHSDVELEKYHNLTVRGSTLREIIVDKFEGRKFHNIDIEYETLEIAKDNNLTSVSALLVHGTSTDKSLQSYINPTGSFKGTVHKNDNGVITKLTYTQTR